MTGHVVYLASPYSHEDPYVRERRYFLACAAAADLMGDGFLVFCPIAHSHPIAMAGALPTDWTYWQDYDRAMLERCDSMVVLKLDGWEASKGVTAEVEIMRQLGKPVTYMEPR